MREKRVVVNLRAISLAIAILAGDIAVGKPILDDRNVVQRGQKRRLCGRILKDQIESICNFSNARMYIPGTGIKGGIVGGGVTHDLHERVAERTNNVRNRRSRGVIDECCRKPCYPQQLLKYCANSTLRHPNIRKTTWNPVGIEEDPSWRPSYPFETTRSSMSMETTNRINGNVITPVRVQRNASQVTDGPPPETFYIPAGTNAEFFSL